MSASECQIALTSAVDETLGKAGLVPHLEMHVLRDSLASYHSALDAPAPPFAESSCGAGKGASDSVYVTVFTGIRPGIISHGKYFIGGLGMGWWHRAHYCG
jgi:hypothetical protein